VSHGKVVDHGSHDNVQMPNSMSLKIKQIKNKFIDMSINQIRIIYQGETAIQFEKDNAYQVNGSAMLQLSHASVLFLERVQHGKMKK